MTRRGHPKGFVALNVQSTGKFHTIVGPPPAPAPFFCATCEKPASKPCITRQSGPYTNA